MNRILRINDKVRHKDDNIDKKHGIMTILEIKGEYAICANLDFSTLGSQIETYLLKNLKLAEK